LRRKDFHVTLHELLLQRIYHEDNLLVQRTYVLVATQSFLLTAFAVLLTGTVWRDWLPVPVGVAMVGGTMAAIHVIFGRQTNRAINFWRVYCRVVEEREGIVLDRALFDFYEHGKVKTSFGVIGPTVPGGLPISRSFPGHTAISRMLGRLLPFSFLALWACVLSIVLLKHPTTLAKDSAWAVWFVLAVFVALYLARRPAQPRLADQTAPDS
jgi:hypothetical protein